jgi:SAM-dependent methyltransferase
MAYPPSLVRVAEHEALKKIELHGSVIDLGGGEDSGYRNIFKGTYTITSANLDGHDTSAIHCDLEKPLPIADASYDGVLMINTLEHIYHARELVQESFRISRPGADVIIAVPFLFPVHPSPSDYWRFTEETLSRMLTDAGYTNVVVTPLCYGVFVTRFVILERLLPRPARILMYVIGAPIAHAFDHAFVAIARMLGKKYEPRHYPGGYLATAKK